MYSIFRDLAIIILSAKFLGLAARKFAAPQVVGEILAGLLIGPCMLNLVQGSDALSTFAEIGVVLLMFTTGLGTNIKELLKAGPIATFIACVGVFVPLVGGTLLYSAFYGFAAVGTPEFFRALFIGTIMTATSVSITVATLQELGHLKSFLGTTIVSAAVIDDVIGIIVLTCVIGASSGEGASLGGVLLNTVLFFLVAIGIFPLIGAVKKDNQLALESGVVCRAECSLTDADIRDGGADGDEASKKANPLRFLLPMIVIIALTIITKDVMVACMGAIAVMIVIMLVARMKLTEIFDAAFEGASSMVSICMIIAVALTLVEINTATGMPDFVVGFLTPLLSGAAFLFPAIVFAFIAIYSFFVGGCWDGSMIFLPIVLPIANAIGVNPILVCAALVSASACSSSWYVASDAMLLTSAATEV